MTDIASIVLAKRQARTVLPKVAYEIKTAGAPLNEDEPRRRLLPHCHNFSCSPLVSEDGAQHSSSEEFEVLVDSEDEMLRPSFLSPKIEKPQDFDLKKIRRSIVPWVLWRAARIANPF